MNRIAESHVGRGWSPLPGTLQGSNRKTLSGRSAPAATSLPGGWQGLRRERLTASLAENQRRRKDCTSSKSSHYLPKNFTIYESACCPTRLKHLLARSFF